MTEGLKTMRLEYFKRRNNSFGFTIKTVNKSLSNWLETRDGDIEVEEWCKLICEAFNSIHAFPTPTAQMDKYPNGCVNGKILIYGNPGPSREENCPTCKGTGQATPPAKPGRPERPLSLEEPHCVGDAPFDDALNYAKELEAYTKSLESKLKEVANGNQ